MFRDSTHALSSRVDAVTEDIGAYLKNNARLITALAVVALATYGFELFNFNLKIDGEMQSLPGRSLLIYLAAGRWGLFLVEWLLFPFPVIPFLPLFTGLVFHIAAILLIISSLGMRGKLEQVITGSICIAYPGAAFNYAFAAAAPVFGIGLLCVALSLFIFVKYSGLRKLWAAFPAAFAISLYEGYIPALLSVYLLYIVYVWGNRDVRPVRTLFRAVGVVLASVLAKFTIQESIILLWRIPISDYVTHFFSIDYLRSNPGWIVHKLLLLMFHVYTGGDSVYGIHVHALALLLFVSALGFLWTVARGQVSIPGKALLLLLTLGFVLIPFVGGLLTKGHLAMRFLVGMPIVISGLVMLGLKNAARLRRLTIAALALLGVFQFASSTNHLFGASHLALQQDRLLGSQLIERIEDARANVGSETVKYIEVVGFLDRPSTPLIPKLDVFGASFFEWDEGSAARVVAFLQILGYYGVEPLPLEQRGRFVETADSMPAWPDRGSVKVVGDVVLVKFGPYSKNQKTAMESIGR